MFQSFVITTDFINSNSSKESVVAETDKIKKDYPIKFRILDGDEYVTGLGCDEWGYVSFNELSELKVGFGLGIERDIYFGKHTVKEILEKN